MDFDYKPYLTQAEIILNELPDYLDFNQKSLQIALASIAFNPIFWNIVARLEYNTHFLTKIAGSAKRGCYFLAFVIFSLGIIRDFIYERALHEQPTYAFLEQDIFKYLSYVFFGVGNIFVVTSMYKLGVTGTYLGDYFGILMDERVTGFPFNVNDNPMYNGSTLCFLGTGLYYAKPTGIVVAGMVWIMYRIALLFEEPFTAKIYAKANEKKTQ